VQIFGSEIEIRAVDVDLSWVLGEPKEKGANVIYVTELAKFITGAALPPIDRETLARLAINGFLVHAGMEEKLRELGAYVEVPVSQAFEVAGEEYVLAGRADALLRPGAQEALLGEAVAPLVPLEIKTAPQLMPEHVAQASIYATILGPLSGGNSAILRIPRRGPHRLYLIRGTVDLPRAVEAYVLSLLSEP